MQGNGYFLVLLRGHGERTEVLVFLEGQLSALSVLEQSVILLENRWINRIVVFISQKDDQSGVAGKSLEASTPNGPSLRLGRGRGFGRHCFGSQISSGVPSHLFNSNSLY